MATADSVKAKMQGLIDSANAKTGGNDTTLTGAVSALIAGFGQGGGSSGGTSGIYVAEVTPEEDTNEIRISHDLNADVLIAALFANEFTLSPDAIDRNFPVMQVYIKTNLDVYTSSSAFLNAFVANNAYNYTNGNIGRTQGYTSNSYSPKPTEDDPKNIFSFQTSNVANSKFKAGQTLRVVIVTEV